MTPERWAAVKRIFAAVVDLPGEECHAALARECAADPALRREVEELLESHAIAPRRFLAEAPLSRVADDPLAALPERFGPCKIEHRLGSGGMGTVFLATMVEERPWAAIGTHVALKVLHPGLALDGGARQRLALEADLGGQLVHPSVVRAHGLESAGEGTARYHGLVQEYVAGQTLRELMQELGTVPEPFLRDLAVQIAAGLAAIHAVPAVHRDLKPENLILTSDHQVKIMDLGIARLLDDSTRLTESRAFVGSSRYAAPEQFEGSALGPAADLYSLGVVLYEAATGTNPFAAPDVHAVMRLHLEKAPPRPGTLRPDLTPFFEEVVLRLLAKKPEGRFASAGELARVLEDGEASEWWHGRASELRGERALRRTRVARETPFVAREDEVTTLLDAWDSARKGHGSLVLVEGEGGIGKSRLVEEALERAASDEEPWLLLEARFEHGSAGLGALGQSLVAHLGDAGLEQRLAPLLTATPGLVGALAALLRGDQPPAGAAPLTPESTATVFCHAARGLAAERPVLWLLEDLHLASGDARAIVLSLARIAADAGLLLVATARQDFPAAEVAALEQAPGARRLVLGRLSAREVVQLVADSLGSTWLGEELGGRVAYRSDGNPFFVVEMLRELRRTGLVEKLHEGATTSEKALAALEVPSSVRGLLEVRLAALVEDDRVLLDAASVAGFEFDPDLVARVLGRERLSILQALARLERRARLVRSLGPAFSFDHHLLVETLYAALPPSLRSEYHGRLALALAARNRLDLAQPERVPGDAAVPLVGHLLRGPRPEEAEPLLAKAVDSLYRRNAHAAVFDMVDLGLGAIPNLDAVRRCDLLLLQAEAAGLLGRSEEEMAAIECAVAAAKDSRDRARTARCHLARGWALTHRHQWASSAAEAEAARRLAQRTGDEATHVRALNLLGLAMAGSGRLSEARGHLERAAGLAAGGRDRALECEALAELGSVLNLTGDNNAAIELLMVVLRSAEELGLTAVTSRARQRLGSALSSAARFAEARRYLEAEVLQSRERGALRNEAIALTALGRDYCSMGNLDEGIRAGERARRLGREGRRSGTESLAELILASIAHYRGDLHLAREHYRASISLAGSESPRLRTPPLIDLASLAMDEGRLDEAELLLDEARDLVGPFAGNLDMLAGWSSELARRRGDRGRALEILREMLATQRDGRQLQLAPTTLSLGCILLELDRRDEALPHLLEAERLCRENWKTGNLPEAYLALAGARDPVSVVVSEDAPVDSRAESRLVLHRAGAGGDHLARARALCELLSRHLEGDGLAQFWRWNPIARGVVEEERRAGATA